MYYKYLRRRKLLNVDDSFARLVSIQQAGYEFEFTYSISQSDAIQNDALSVLVDVSTNTIHKKSVMAESQRGTIDTHQLIRNILTQTSDAKNVIKKRNTFVAASKVSDITSKVNNEIVSKLAAGAKTTQLTQTYRSVTKTVKSSALKSTNDLRPVLQTVAHVSIGDMSTTLSASLSANPQSLMQDMLLRQGLDPTNIMTLTDRSTSFDDAAQGTLRRTLSAEQSTDPSTQLLNYHIFNANKKFQAVTSDDIDDDRSISVLSSESKVDVEIPVKIMIPRDQLKIAQGKVAPSLFVKFTLLNSNDGSAIDVVTKTLSLSQHIQFYNTPHKPPIVNVVKSEVSTHANLEIKQVDEIATAVQIYKKNVYMSTSDIADYGLMGTYQLTAQNQTLLVPVDLPRNSIGIYRVVPIGAGGVQGSEYTNAIVKSHKFYPLNSISLTTLVTERGIQVEVRKIPSHVIAMQLLVRNLSLHEFDYTSVGSAKFVSEQVRKSDLISVVDTNVMPDWIYEYTAKLIYKSGTEENAGSAVSQYMQVKPGRFDTKIDGITVSHNDQEPDVSFSIATNTIDNNIDVVRKLLDKQGILKYFDPDVTAQRGSFKGVVAHSVQRVDLTTGQRESFGTTTEDTFSDSSSRQKLGVSALKMGHKYRYEISTLIRMPETLLEELVVNNVDPTTKKPYSFKPSKFLHPVALKTGTIVSSRGLKIQRPEDEMQLGVDGQVHVVNISLGSNPASISNFTAAKFDKDNVVLTWKVRGDVASIDHFLIMKESLGVRTIVGKSHCEFANNNCRYVHHVTRHDVGEFIYVMTPIFNDYSVGAETSTSAITI